MGRKGYKGSDQNKKYINKDGHWACPYCKEEKETKREVLQHIKNCSIAKDLPRDSLGKIKCSSSPISNKDCICVFCGAVKSSPYSKRAHELYCTKNPNRLEGVFKGKHHTPEQKAKLVQSMIDRLQESSKYGAPRFNKDACKYLDKLNEEKGWELQHAMNGGEISCAPYYMDGYDKKRNICVEYFERAHYRNESIIKKDKDRLTYMHSKLNCEIYVFNSVANKLERIF